MALMPSCARQANACGKRSAVQLASSCRGSTTAVAAARTRYHIQTMRKKAPGQHGDYNKFNKPQNAFEQREHYVHETF